MCLLSLFFGLAGDDLLLDVGLGDGILGGDHGVLDLLLGGDLAGNLAEDLSLMLCTASLLVLEAVEYTLASALVEHSSPRHSASGYSSRACPSQPC